MKQTRRLLAALLAAVMLFSASPLAYAAQMEDEEAVVAEETEPEATEEVTEEAPAEEPEESEELEEPEEEASAEAVELVEPEAILPYGLKGMPESFRLSQKEMSLKQQMAHSGFAQTVQTLTEGEDYSPKQVFFLAKNRSYAETVAEAYNAELIRFGYGIAVLELNALSVAEAVNLSADARNSLPAVSPNLRLLVEPDAKDREKETYRADSALEAPSAESWESIVSNLDDPDPLLLFPEDYGYQWFHDVVNTYEAWSVTSGSPTIKVAVIDTGVDSHTGEFVGRLKQVDVGFGLEPNMEFGEHGTFVASCIGAALGNGVGGAGIAPGVSLVSYRIQDENGYLDDAASLTAILSAMGYDMEGAYHPENAVDIANMSFGGAVYSPFEESIYEMAYEAGVTLIAAAGNEQSNNLSYPACYSCVISVAATNRSNTRSAFSTYGSYVDVAAPGTDIPGVVPYGDMAIMSGTSFACPITAGVAALYMSKVGHVAPATMRSVLKASVTKIGDKTLGAGIVDAAKLFANDKTAPKIYIFNETYDVLPGTSITVSVDGGFAIEPLGTNDAMLLYTLDGKNPAVKDGEVVSGTQYYLDAVNSVIKFDNLTPGKYTLKAAAVNAMGAVSKIASVKLTITESKFPRMLTITAPEQMAAGTSVTLKAAALPANAAQDVTWRLKEAVEGVTLNGKTGLLKAAANVDAEVTVIAASVINPDLTAEATITIALDAPAAKITLSSKTMTLHCYNPEEDGSRMTEQKQLTVTIADKDGNGLEHVSYTFTSSNTKVAAVSADGMVVGLSKGTAVITAKALDGSNKSAACKVTVTPGVERVSLTGQLVVAPGSTVTYKAVTNPAKVTGAVVTMGIESAPESVTFRSGKLTVSRDAVVGSSFLVWAQAQDGNNLVQDVLHVTVGPKASKVNVQLDRAAFAELYDESVSMEEALVEYKESKGNLTNVTLFTTGALGYGNVAFLNADVVGGVACGTWTNSNPKAAELIETDAGCMVIGKAAGTAKITYTQNDGSKLKKTVTVKVVVPASSAAVVPVNRPVEDGFNFLYFGKTAKNTLVLGDAFGKPTKSKAAWDFTVYDDEGNDMTAYAKANKYVTVNSSGVVSLSKKFEQVWRNLPGDVYIDVFASALYGTQNSIPTTYVCCPAPKGIEVYDAYPCFDEEGNWVNSELFLTKNRKITLYPQAQTDGNYDGAMYFLELTGSWYHYFNVQSSNPDIASATIGYDSEAYYDAAGNPHGMYYVEILSCGQKKGTCKITVSSADSLKLSTTFTVTVK